MKQHSANSPEDSVSSAFSRMRQEISRRGGTAPHLSKPSQRKKRRSDSTKQIGRPTGKDGRAIPYADYSMEGISTLLSREIEQRGWGKDLAGGWVSTHWAELVGDHIAAHTRVQMLKDKALFISCNSTAWASNLRTMQRHVLEKIANRVGPDIVTELRIFGPQAPSWRFGPLHVKGRGPRDTYG